MLDVTDIEKVERGDIAVVIGKSGGVEISVCDVAEQAGTISTEVLNRLGTRLKRVVLGVGSYAG